MSDSIYSVFSKKKADPTQQTENLSLYEKLGGAQTVNLAVDVFYRKVMRDARINYFFFGVNLTEQAQKQKAFLSMAFGGPHQYTGRDMRKSHAKLVDMGMNDRHFNIVMDHLRDTLIEIEVSDPLIEEVLRIAESTREDVMGRSHKQVSPPLMGKAQLLQSTPTTNTRIVSLAPSGHPRAAPNTVGAIMSGSLISLQPQMSIADAVTIMIQSGLSQLPVVNHEGRLLGILSANDLLKHTNP